MTANLATPLPKAVLQRPKTGFSVLVREWLTRGVYSCNGQTHRGLRAWAVMLHEQLF